MEQNISDGMCRCCASEGSFKDFQTTYHWMGEEEIYSEMIKECFDLSLSTSDLINNGGICEVCITQLRNAFNFKRQVQMTEEQFKKKVHETVFKSNTIKLEVSRDDDDDDDDAEELSDFEIEIKEEKIEDKSKKRQEMATTSKAKTSKAEGETSKRQKISVVSDCDQVEDLPQRAHEKPGVGTKKKKRAKTSSVKEVVKHRENVIEVLLHSNATPIRCKVDLGYGCVFCKDYYPNPADLKKHTLMEHEEEAIVKVVRDFRIYTVKLDVTDLQCSICELDLDSIDELLEHLVAAHDRTLHLDIRNHMVPFKFIDDELRCAMCDATFAIFRHLVKHMNTHYRNFVCDYCGDGFVNRDILRCHRNTHMTGTFDCKFCPKSFNTTVKRKSHIQAEHKKVVRKCGYCSQLFDDYEQKNTHLAKCHGVDIAPVKCKICDKSFARRALLGIHTRKVHFKERKYQCDLCKKKFFNKQDLIKHMIIHTKERKYPCTVCAKRFGFKFALKHHMKIHTKDKKKKKNNVL